MVYFQQQQNLWIYMVFVVIISLVCGYANKYQLTVTVWFKILFLKKSILRTLNKCHYKFRIIYSVPFTSITYDINLV